MTQDSARIFDQRAAFQLFKKKVVGFVGLHNASAMVLEDWNWYTKLVGARFASEIETQPLVCKLSTPSTS
jgi:hypothetical protein